MITDLRCPCVWASELEVVLQRAQLHAEPGGHHDGAAPRADGAHDGAVAGADGWPVTGGGHLGGGAQGCGLFHGDVGQVAPGGGARTRAGAAGRW